MTRNGTLTFAIWALVIAAVVPVAIASVVFFPVLVLFGADPPQTTRLSYLFAISQPLLATLAVVSLGAASVWLWSRTRWKVPAFLLALILCASIWSLGAWFFYK
jgi:hypothetical protein